MRALLREAMEEGAWGMSTGLDYPPAATRIRMSWWGHPRRLRASAASITRTDERDHPVRYPSPEAPCDSAT